MPDTARDTFAANEHGFGGPHPSLMIATDHPLIPGYRMERLIGSGGMASVYLAIQESLERPVALKILDDPESPEYQERFLNEGRIIASLTHSNIITVHDIGIAERHLYISMEYVEGGDLRRRIKQGMTPPVAFDIVERIGGALKLAHDKGVIHRDVKPANILFRLDGTPVLADFGIAKNYQRDSGLTMDGSVVGSPYYLSPEQARAQTIDGRADIYSLGIILFEMLTGEKPYKGESAVDTVFKHLNDPVPTLPEELVRLQHLLDKMLAKEPADRFDDIDDMLESVHQVRARGFDDIADRMVRGTDTVLLMPGSVGRKALREAAGKASRRRRRHVYAVAAALVVLAASAMLHVGRDDMLTKLNHGTRPAAAPREAVAASHDPAQEKRAAAGAASGAAPRIAPVTVDPTFDGSMPAAEPAPARPAREKSARVEREPPVADPAAAKARASDGRSVVAAASPKPPATAAADRAPASPSTASSSPPSKPSRKPASEPVRKPSGTVERPVSPSVSRRRSPAPVTTRPRPPPTAFKSSREREVERLIGLARTRIGEGKLSSPPRDSALYYRDEALALDPDNAAARRLSTAIADRHLALAQNELRRGDYFEAKRHIDEGLEVAPGHARLRALRKSALESAAKGIFDQFKRSLWEVEPDMSVRPRSATER